MRRVTLPSALVSPALQPRSTLERLDDLLRADDCARDVRAHLDEMLADRCQVELVVERGDRVHVRRRLVECVGYLADHVGREPAVLGLREPQRRQHRALRVGRILRALGLDRVVEGAHRSTSPITVSSEPTIAIMSAISASVMHVAVACSATNDGARNLTRHGLGPPSEQM